MTTEDRSRLERASAYLAWFLGVPETMSDDDWYARGEGDIPEDGDLTGVHDARDLIETVLANIPSPPVGPPQGTLTP